LAEQDQRQCPCSDKPWNMAPPPTGSAEFCPRFVKIPDQLMKIF
jgi:hypothetical protein